MDKNKFSKTWKTSKQPRKQRKYRYKAPLHIRQKFVHAHLSKDLRKKYGFRNIQLKTGDRVRIVRGQFRKKEGKVERISLKKEKIFIIGIERIKKDGTKQLVAFSPSNLVITEINLDDRKRKQKIESSSKGELKEGKKEKQKEEKQKEKHEDKK